MKSLDKNANFIEKTVTQGTDENDWLDFTSTTLTYKPEDIRADASSTATSLVFNNNNAADKNVVLVTNDGTSDSLHELYVDGNNVVYNGLDLVNITETNQLTASDAEAGDYFGMSVAITSDGLVAMVGALFEDTAGSDAGKVYTYKRVTIDDAWVEVNQLTASDAQDSDGFGASVAITGDGLVAMVGVYLEDTAGSDAGKVYTYKRVTIDDAWVEVNQLTASDAAGSDYFGNAVAITGDGLVAMVGAFLEDTAGSNTGKVYTYKRTTIDDAWTEVGQLTASDAQSDDYFGISVVITSDGLVAMVGAVYEDTAGSNAGKVYTYKRATVDDTWTGVSQLTASDAQDSDQFGRSVAIVGDGLVAIVGAHGEDAIATDAGKVYIYKRATIDDAWTEVNQLTASDARSGDFFGVTVAISSDCTVLMIGAYDQDTAGSNAGKVYTYSIPNLHTLDITDANLPSAPTYGYIESNIDVTVDVDVDETKLLNLPVNYIPVVSKDLTNKTLTLGSTINVPAKVMIGSEPLTLTSITDNGDNTYTIDTSSLANMDVDYIYVKDSLSLPVTSSTTTTVVSDSTAKVVANGDVIYVDGTEVVVSDVSGTGDVTLDIQEVNKMGSGKSSDLYGYSVALAVDGLVAMVGAFADDAAGTDAGKVYTYKRTTLSDSWTEVNNMLPDNNIWYGTGVALTPDGLIAIVGSGYDAGKVYTYKRTTIDDAWSEVSQLTASDTQSGDHFGFSVAITGDGLVAMIGTHAGGTATGKVYTYKRTNIDDGWTEVSKLTASDDFGFSAAITSDGLVAMVGARVEDTAASNAGKVYTYKRATIDDTWSEVSQLTASDAQSDDYFGSDVAITPDGLVAMVGANGEDTAGSNAGKVYTYKRATIDDAWTEVNMLTASDAAASDRFGAGVAITSDGLVAMVGASQLNNSVGKVYTYNTGINHDVTLTIPEQPSAPATAIVLDKSTNLSLDDSSYSNGIITNTYKEFSEQSRAIKRAIHIEQPNVEVLTPFTTTVNKLN